MQIGIYEQIINQLFEEKIASIDREQFYIGERSIERHEVAKLLAMYLTGIFEQILSDVSDLEDEDIDDVEEQKKDGVRKGVNLANAIIKKLIDEFHLESGNLLSAQAKILTAVIDKTQSDYPDLAKRLGIRMTRTTPIQVPIQVPVQVPIQVQSTYNHLLRM